MESFGSHLIKGIWKRTESYYQFLTKYDEVYKTGQPIHPLEDFRIWLLTLYKRVASLQNLKIRKFVQKETLKREYITVHMKEFYFREFLAMLNSGLIYKDVNIYTIFSKNSEQVLSFFQRYFDKESLDKEGDLALLFDGFKKVATHPQSFLILLKLLSF